MKLHYFRAFLLILIAVSASAVFGAQSKRVLIVSSDPLAKPTIYAYANGEYVITDLVAAGLPFDVVPYSRFVTMDMGDHDVVILNGYTSPTPLTSVVAKCQSIIRSGAKVFINGDKPYRQYDTTGKQLSLTNFATTLFGVQDLGLRNISGGLTVPSYIEKDNWITQYVSLTGLQRVFSCPAGSFVKMTVSGYAFGFLTPQGGALNDSGTEAIFGVLDYAKVVEYLRYGNAGLVGFANDRIDGKPVVSIEVHCDDSKDITAINALVALSNKYQIPLTNLLVYKSLTTKSIAAWNAAAGPLMKFGSHSRTHPFYWKDVPDVLYESRDALNDQRKVVPSTGPYFDFSGDMSPLPSQLSTLVNAGVLFGAAGADDRTIKQGDGTSANVEKIPTISSWTSIILQSPNMPYFLGHTIDCDYWNWKNSKNYAVEAERNFDANVKYGMYTFGFIHDYMMNPSNSYYTNGVHLSVLIDSAIGYMASKSAKFIDTESLIRRLRDYQAGWIDYEPTQNGGLRITAHRPSSLINQVKVQCRDNLMPVATPESLNSVLSQHRVGNLVYFDLVPNVETTFEVSFQAIKPDTPVVSVPDYISENLSAQWDTPNGPWDIVEYQYALGSTPGGIDIVNWKSNGRNKSIELNHLPHVNGNTYYLSVKGLSDHGIWSDVCVSNPVFSDLTPPTTPLVVDGGEFQVSYNEISAAWSSEDPETDVIDYNYAVGTAPGSTDVLDWTDAGTLSSKTITGLSLFAGHTYYVSVRAKNRAGLWSDTGSSDGISIRVEDTVAGAKKCEDGWKVDIVQAVVSAIFPDCIYIEQMDRSAGVKTIGFRNVYLGDIIDVSGTMDTSNGERIVKNAIIDKSIGQASRKIGPLGMTIASVTGCSTSGSKNVGISTVGLLVKVAGVVISNDSSNFTINDGSALPLKISVPIGAYVPRVGDFISAVGIVSSENHDGQTLRVLDVVNSSDISIIKQKASPSPTAKK